MLHEPDSAVEPSERPTAAWRPQSPTRSDVGEEFWDPPCRICKKVDDEPNVLCELCNGAYHVFCIATVKPPLPRSHEDDEWFCRGCIKRGVPEEIVDRVGRRARARHQETHRALDCTRVGFPEVRPCARGSRAPGARAAGTLPPSTWSSGWASPAGTFRGRTLPRSTRRGVGASSARAPDRSAASACKPSPCKPSPCEPSPCAPPHGA